MIYGLVYVLGILFSFIPVYYIVKSKRFSHVNIVYSSLLLLISFWQFLNLYMLYDSKNSVVNEYLISVVIITVSMILMVLYVVTIYLKRNPLVWDLIILFPLLAINIFYVINNDWIVIQTIPITAVMLFSESSFYWLASIVWVLLYSLKTLAVILSWDVPNTVRVRIKRLMIIIGLAGVSGLLFDVLLFPYVFKIPLGGPIVSLIFLVHFLIDKNTKKVRSSKEVVKRVNSFL